MASPRKISIIGLQQELFKPYGRLLEPDEIEVPEVSESGRFDFYVTFKESAQGWQIGYLFNEEKMINQLERHPNTAEVFSPLNGESVLIVSENPEDENTIIAFKLDKSIVLSRGAWHGVISLSDRAEILIVESPDVIDEYYQLSSPVSVQ
ncbi:MAG: ureidoglycolate lyase [Spirochaetes bacterium]|nr:ureidoglycolate lyase [Spirochaetota bacterium]MCK5095472.1 ureidoglycolate lyase [Spirochaetota bacterium]